MLWSFFIRYVQICCTQKNGTVDKQYVSFDGTNTVYVPGGAEVTRIPKGSQTYDVSNIPENTTHIDVNYVWGLTQTFSDNEVSNVICEVNRTIEQNSIKKEAVKNEENIDVYNVIGTDKLTLTYNASMNMENLQSNIAGAGSWDVLKNTKRKSVIPLSLISTLSSISRLTLQKLIFEKPTWSAICSPSCIM